MKHKRNLLAAAALALVGQLALAAGEAARVGVYDFSYVTSGDVRATPVQVFDDGKNTFFQFRAGDIVPAIFSSRNGIPQLVMPVQEGPYVKVGELHGRFLLQSGRSQAQVVHSGATRPDAPVLSTVSSGGVSRPYSGGPVAQGAHLVASLAPTAGHFVDDAIKRNSYATPSKGDKVVWTEGEPRRDELQLWFARGSAALSAESKRTIANAARAVSKSRYVVVGRDDDSYKEGLDMLRARTVRQALVKAGVPEDQITVRGGIAAKSRGSNRASDLIVETERPDADLASSSSRNRTAQANLQALVRAGVLRPDQAEAIMRSRGIAPTRLAAGDPGTLVPPGGFTLTVADRTVQGAVRRWASSLSYELVWDAPPRLDAPIMGDIQIPAGNIQEALNRLLAGLNDKGYALDATVYANRVIRLTAASAGAPATGAPNVAAPEREAPKEVKPSPRQEKVQPARQTLAQPTQWQMLLNDRNVQHMLSRWAADSQWTVVWNAREQVPIIGETTLSGPNFKAVAEQLIAKAAAAGYRLRVSTTSDEKTLVVSGY